MDRCHIAQTGNNSFQGYRGDVLYESDGTLARVYFHTTAIVPLRDIRKKETDMIAWGLAPVSRTHSAN
jgi:hypothetical protein